MARLPSRLAIFGVWIFLALVTAVKADRLPWKEVFYLYGGFEGPFYRSVNTLYEDAPPEKRFYISTQWIYRWGSEKATQQHPAYIFFYTGLTNFQFMLKYSSTAQKWYGDFEYWGKYPQNGAFFFLRDPPLVEFPLPTSPTEWPRIGRTSSW